MGRLNLLETLKHLRAEMDLCVDEDSVGHFRRLATDAERRLAQYDANTSGASFEARRVDEQLTRPGTGFLAHFEASPVGSMLLDPRAGLHIIDVNRAYASATLVEASKVAGQRLFDVFPDNPDDPAANGVVSLFDSLRVAAVTLRPDKMDVQRYDIRNASGEFVQRFWRCTNEPIFDESGMVKYLLHTAVDVTAKVEGRAQTRAM